MASTVIYTPRNYIQMYDQIEQYLVGSGVGLTNFNIGSRIRALIEAFCIVSGQTHYDFYFALQGAIPIALYDGMQFFRNAGLRATGTVVFGLDTVQAVDIVVPVGTTLNVNGNGYVTTTAGTILAGQHESEPITLQAMQSGMVMNLAHGDIDTRSNLGYIDNSTDFDYAYNTTAIGGGTDEETDTSRRERFISYINGLTKTTVVGIEAQLLAISSVRAVYVRELFPEPGWNTVYVDDGSGAISPTLLTQVYAIIFGQPTNVSQYPGCKAAGIRMNVEAPTMRHFVITYKLYIDANSLSTPSFIIAGAETSISNYIGGLKLGEDVFFTEIIAMAHEFSPDILDVEISDITVDGIPIPLANFPVAANEICRVDSFVSSYELIYRTGV